eukprot:TRINITY_DN29682_c0_g1_i1.p1 TRINITY_DN29682_c0_g1~~TRINITY_DN29682_c0_g1_i1.p1  ORF type:complete len:488 (+),score=205.74 TRINITY_DN29682_c0_g1_i1:122-1585(+)
MSVRRVGGAGAAAPPAGARARRVCADVYPDPEPDSALDELLVKIAKGRPRGLFGGGVRLRMDASGKLFDEDGRQYGPDGHHVETVPEAEEVPEEKADFYDPTLVHKKPAKRRDRLAFHDEGESTHTERANRLRELEGRRKALIARKGAAEPAEDAAPAEPAPPAVPQEIIDATTGADLLAVPAMEWWDKLILPGQDDYAAIPTSAVAEDGAAADVMKWGAKIKSLGLVEHPVPIEGPNVEAPLAPQPLMLTKKERKRRRTDARVTREKEKQEQIALGLMQPPPPKVRISNMMKVMGKEAIQDPTLIEKFVREEEMSRVARHEARNHERKLAPEDRRSKKIEKMQTAADDDPMTTVFRINKLHSNQAIFKITENAKQHHLSGFLVTTESGINMILIEGGRRPTRKYTRLILQRIDYKLDDGEDNAANASIVWQGYGGKKKLFNAFRTLTFTSDDKAKRYMTNQECSQYWDMLVSGRQLGETATTDELL